MDPEISGFKTRKELAQLLKIHVSTLDKRIKPIKPLLSPEKPKRIYPPGEVRIVLEHFGFVPAV